MTVHLNSAASPVFHSILCSILCNLFHSMGRVCEGREHGRSGHVWSVCKTESVDRVQKQGLGSLPGGETCIRRSGRRWP